MDDATLRPGALLADLIERHGPWRVVVALAAQLARRRPRAAVVRLADLPDHLRRDIGLPDLPARPTEPRRAARDEIALLRL